MLTSFLLRAVPPFAGGSRNFPVAGFVPLPLFPGSCRGEAQPELCLSCEGCFGRARPCFCPPLAPVLSCLGVALCPPPPRASGVTLGAGHSRSCASIAHGDSGALAPQGVQPEAAWGPGVVPPVWLLGSRCGSPSPFQDRRNPQSHWGTAGAVLRPGVTVGLHWALPGPVLPVEGHAVAPGTETGLPLSLCCVVSGYPLLSSSAGFIRLETL